MRIVFCGQTRLDLIHRVDSFPRSGEKHTAIATALDIGGVAANAARTAALFTADAVLVSPVGQGAQLQVVRGFLDAANVALEPLESASVPAATLVVEADGTTSALVPDTATMPHGFPAADVLEGADALVVDAEVSDVGLALARTARQRGIPVILGVDYPTESVRSFLDHVDVIIAGAGFSLPTVSDDSLLLWLSSRGVGTVAQIMSDGAVRAIVDGEAYELAAEPIEHLEDSIGITDVFVGAYAGLSETGSTLEVLGSAAEVARASVSYQGALGWGAVMRGE
ncbi:PfkB family carbohydrate kinase [Neoactinobaculum massilliense]|uniref:PfkB family carbohydrate kinase n=1 Tax=Neoactinobaculum massilliense TaxID=2364794 RepID=UPI000F53A248|nr:PfkB family carbohydrate kinase [Neoactinobaculum massilliense]